MSTLATITITNLRLQTIIGCNEWEREQKQEIVINITLVFDASEAIGSDLLEKSVDYRALKKRIIQEVSNSSFKLLERLTSHIVSVIMDTPKVLSTTVKIDKPNALRYADSVSITLSAQR